MQNNLTPLRDKIAWQIEKIVRESVKIDLEIAAFLKEDFDEIRHAGESRGLSFVQTVGEVLEGIRKGLVHGGVENFKLIRSILHASKKSLNSLEDKRDFTSEEQA